MKKIVCWKLKLPNLKGDDSEYIFVSDEEEAKRINKECGYPLNHHIVPRKHTLTIYDTAIEYRPQEFDIEAKISALEKLSDREQRALGIWDGILRK